VVVVVVDVVVVVEVVVVLVEEVVVVEEDGLRRRTTLRWLDVPCFSRLAWSAPETAEASWSGCGAGSGSWYCATPRFVDALAADAIAQPMDR